MRNIQMVDLRLQHRKIHSELTEAIGEVIEDSSFINGPAVHRFTDALASYTGAKYIVPCANGTDALQIALMALELPQGSEVIVPAFNYVSAAEVVALAGLIPVFADVDPVTFTLSVEDLRDKISDKTRAVIPVHLFGQCAGMEKILAIAEEKNLYVIEDAAQALGATYKLPDGRVMQAGTMGTAGITSFFPTKNLGGMGDGGAIFTDDENLAEKMRLIANHGQKKKYSFESVGMNSRLDSLQAAILNVKLKYLRKYIDERRKVAELYSQNLKSLPPVLLPEIAPANFHTWNQYTIRIADGERDELRRFLSERKIPSAIYYPLPLHRQPAYRKYASGNLPVSENLCKIVLSLPIHTEMDEEQILHITSMIREGVKELVK